jgi:hypothetical protein
MTDELKTLKDLIHYELFSEEKEGLEEAELRQEAIKWVKDLKKNYINAFNMKEDYKNGERTPRGKKH